MEHDINIQRTPLQDSPPTGFRVGSRARRRQIEIVAVALLLSFGLYSIVGKFVERLDRDSQSSKAMDYLFVKGDQFNDFFNVNRFVLDPDPYSTGTSYPPLALVVAWPFSQVPQVGTFLSDTFSWQGLGRVAKINRLFPLLILFVITLVPLFLACWSALKSAYGHQRRVRSLLVALALTLVAPLIFVIDRGNYLIVAVLLFSFATYSLKERPVLSAVLLGLCAALKVYPILLILYFLVEKKWFLAGVFLLSGCIATVLPLFFFPGGFIENLTRFLSNMFAFGSGSATIGTVPSLWFSVSWQNLVVFPFIDLTNLPKMGSPEISSVLEPSLLLTLLPAIRVIIAVAALTAFFRLTKLTNDFSLRWAGLVVVMIGIVPNSYDYNLAYLIAVFVLVLCFGPMRQWRLFLWFGLLLLPKAFFYFGDSPLGINSVLDPILLGLLLLELLRTAKADSQKGASTRQPSLEATTSGL